MYRRFPHYRYDSVPIVCSCVCIIITILSAVIIQLFGIIFIYCFYEGRASNLDSDLHRYHNLGWVKMAQTICFAKLNKSSLKLLFLLFNQKHGPIYQKPFLSGFLLIMVIILLTFTNLYGVYIQPTLDLGCSVVFKFNLPFYKRGLLISGLTNCCEKQTCISVVAVRFWLTFCAKLYQ